LQWKKKLNWGILKKRFDIVVYDAASTPWMIVECKEMNVELNKQVLDQVLRYNITMQVPYLVITNGSYCMAFQCINNELKELSELPLKILIWPLPLLSKRNHKSKIRNLAVGRQV